MLEYVESKHRRERAITHEVDELLRQTIYVIEVEHACLVTTSINFRKSRRVNVSAGVTETALNQGLRHRCIPAPEIEDESGANGKLFENAETVSIRAIPGESELVPAWRPAVRSGGRRTLHR
jgi:hypothetical protein